MDNTEETTETIVKQPLIITVGGDSYKIKRKIKKCPQGFHSQEWEQLKTTWKTKPIFTRKHIKGPYFTKGEVPYWIIVCDMTSEDGPKEVAIALGIGWLIRGGCYAAIVENAAQVFIYSGELEEIEKLAPGQLFWPDRSEYIGCFVGQVESAKPSYLAWLTTMRYDKEWYTRKTDYEYDPGISLAYGEYPCPQDW